VNSIKRPVLTTFQEYISIIAVILKNILKAIRLLRGL
jgi:hypothetical protein